MDPEAQREILLSLGELRQEMGQLQGKMDRVLEDNSRTSEAAEKVVVRVGALERWQARTLGLGAALGTGGGGMIAALLSWLKDASP